MGELEPQQAVRILQVVGGLNRGGVETWLGNLLSHIDHRRYKMDFLVHTTEPSSYDEKIRSLGGRIIPCLFPSQPWAYACNFRRILREFGPYDVVHAHVYLFNSLPLALAATAGVPGRISHIYPNRDVRRHTVQRRFARLAAGYLISMFATETLTDSQTTLRSLARLYKPRRRSARVVYCGTPLDDFSRTIDVRATRKQLGLPIDKRVIVYVARFVPHKNHAQILRLANKLNRDGHNYHFVVAGSHGPLLDQLRTQISGRQDVSFIDGLPDVSKLLLASDLFCFPSLEEGFGLVAVEAGAAGLPVVATNLPAIREACAPSNREFMFAPNDDEAAARNIARILEDEDLRCKLSGDAREWARQFSIERSAAQMTAVYDRYARKAPVGAPGPRDTGL